MDIPELMIYPDEDGVPSRRDFLPFDPSESNDIDGDGIGDNADTDNDNDGTLDVLDPFPLDPTEQLDTDQDGIGNNADTDDDNDSIPDSLDDLPLNPHEFLDADKDGIGNIQDTDDDNDGVADTDDHFPLDWKYSVDTDSDGMPDAWEQSYGLDPADPTDATSDYDNDGAVALQEFIEGNIPMPDTDGDGIDNHFDNDDDGDGVADNLDHFPLDAEETLDSDADGIGNNADTDDDNDGIEDLVELQNGLDPLVANIDIDNDGIANAEDTDNDNDGQIDAFDARPFDATEQLDTDNDGIGNNADLDDDNDGIQDVLDHFPLNAYEIIDSDGDGVGDNEDRFPNRAEYSQDNDLDQIPDQWELKYGLDPMDATDAADDQDNDGYTALEEFEAGTIPLKVLDIDGNGSFDALTDGLIILRYAFGLRGENLVSGALASGSLRTDAAEVEAYLDSLVPSF